MTVASVTGESPSVETGYLLERVYFHQLVMESVPADDLPDVGPEDGTSIGWDWAWLTHDVFDVNVRFEIQPTRERSERLTVVVIGRFRLVGPDVTVALDKFVQFAAPAILFPYIRQQVSTLTAAGRFAPLVMPPLNIQALMANLDPKKTTASKKGRPPAGDAVVLPATTKG